ncbi:MAG TPA: hypothetical protein VMS37_28545 [Verrucomicrobiae bacterium]|nr:hypothetical protein [Verrucomicrobiae bacterium]
MKIQLLRLPRPRRQGFPEASGEPQRQAGAFAHWRLVVALLALLTVTLAWFPTARVPAQMEFKPNEGFSSYFQQTAAIGGRVYGKPPLFYRFRGAQKAQRC